MQGVTGVELFLEILDEYSDISIPLSYDLYFGVEGFDGVLVTIDPVVEDVFWEVDVSCKYHTGIPNEDIYQPYKDSMAVQYPFEYETYEVIFTRYDPGYDLVSAPSCRFTQSAPSDFDEATYLISAQYVAYWYYLQQPLINIAFESNLGDGEWTIYEFEGDDGLILVSENLIRNREWIYLEDADGDGVKNSIDECHYWKNVAVGENGCPTDLIGMMEYQSQELNDTVKFTSIGIFCSIFLLLALIKIRKRKQGTITVESSKKPTDIQPMESPILFPPEEPAYLAKGIIGDDGYEWFEFPSDSGKHFYRVPGTDSWKKWD